MPQYLFNKYIKKYCEVVLLKKTGGRQELMALDRTLQFMDVWEHHCNETMMIATKHQDKYLRGTLFH